MAKIKFKKKPVVIDDDKKRGIYTHKKKVVTTAGIKISSKKKKKKKKNKSIAVSALPSYVLYLDGIAMPVPPSKFYLTISNRNETIELASGEQVNRLKSPGLTEIKVDDLILPQQQYPFANYPNGFKNASYYLELIEKWKDEKSVISLVLSRVSNGALLYDTNMDVTVEDVEEKEDAEEQGDDVYVDITFKAYKHWGAKKLVITSKSKKRAKIKKKRSSKKVESHSYTVKKGDTLKSIAKKELGSTSKASEIYSKNKNTIEKAAKKNGRSSSSKGFYIYPGTKLKIGSG